MTSTNRRNLLVTGVAVIGGMGMGGVSTCSTSTGGIDPALLDKINQAIATGCNAVATASTIVALVAAIVPGLTAATVTVAQIAQIAEAFCHAIQQPPQAGKYSAKYGSTEVEVHGWIVKDNKVTPF